MRTYCSSRLSKVIDLGVNGNRICDCLLVTDSMTLNVSPTVFWILTFKADKWLGFPTLPLFNVPAQGNPLVFRHETYLTKTRWMGAWGYRTVKIS